MSALRALLGSAIDYAGLFPPAGLDMEKTVRNYASYWKGPERWALGKLIVPVSRLGEFAQAAAPLLKDADPWPLSVLGGNDLAADLKAIAAFGSPGARIRSLEIKAATAGEIRKAAALVAGTIETFYEIPVAQDPRDLLDAVKEAGGRAKIRTGGTTRGAAPSPEQLARFLDLAQCRVAFKATAGLHHAVRGLRPLTYEAGCESDVMHGFLNLFFAACLAPLVENESVLCKVLEERKAGAFRMDPAAWNDYLVSEAEIRFARSEVLLSFGSCSFEEPIAELKGFGFL